MIITFAIQSKPPREKLTAPLLIELLIGRKDIVGGRSYGLWGMWCQGMNPRLIATPQRPKARFS